MTSARLSGPPPRRGPSVPPTPPRSPLSGISSCYHSSCLLCYRPPPMRPLHDRIPPAACRRSLTLRGFALLPRWRSRVRAPEIATISALGARRPHLDRRRSTSVTRRRAPLRSLTACVRLLPLDRPLQAHDPFPSHRPPFSARPSPLPARLASSRARGQIQPPLSPSRLTPRTTCSSRLLPPQRSAPLAPLHDRPHLTDGAFSRPASIRSFFPSPPPLPSPVALSRGPRRRAWRPACRFLISAPAGLRPLRSPLVAGHPRPARRPDAFPARARIPVAARIVRPGRRPQSPTARSSGRPIVVSDPASPRPAPSRPRPTPFQIPLPQPSVPLSPLSPPSPSPLLFFRPLSAPSACDRPIPPNKAERSDLARRGPIRSRLSVRVQTGRKAERIVHGVAARRGAAGRDALRVWLHRGAARSLELASQALRGAWGADRFRLRAPLPPPSSPRAGRAAWGARARALGEAARRGARPIARPGAPARVLPLAALFERQSPRRHDPERPAAFLVEGRAASAQP